MTRVRHAPTGGHGFKSRHTVTSGNRIDAAKRQRVHGEKTPETLVRFSGVSTGAHELSVFLASSESAFHCGVFGRRGRSTTPTMREHTTTTRSNSCINPLTWSRWSNPPVRGWTTQNRSTTAGFTPGGPTVHPNFVTVAQKTRRNPGHDPHTQNIEYMEIMNLGWTVGPPPGASRRRPGVSGGPPLTPGGWTGWTTLSEVTQ
jgi:hypothetical protein